MMLELPIGISDFKELIEQKYHFVDKSLFIKELIYDGAKVILIPRPRRFGKTINLSMAHYFFNCATSEDNSHLFKDLAIQNCSDCMAKQASLPSIFLTFKGVKSDNYDEAFKRIRSLTGELYAQYRHILNSDALIEQDRIFYNAILALGADQVDVGEALKKLTKYLHAVYKKKVLIFLDEYDTPVQAAYLNGYYDQMIDFMRAFMGEAFKDNIHLHKGVITGILRIAQTSIFSDLNNIETYSLLRREYSEYFGFTQVEVDHLLTKAELTEHKEDIRNWYNGYQVKELKLYNPWSILNCVKQKGLLIPYWIHTSDNALIKHLIRKHRHIIQPLLEELLQFHAVKRPIDENIVFPFLEQNTQAFWSVLLFSGYLTVSEYVVGDDGLMHCQVFIPNQEIMTLYVRMIREWFSENLDISRYEVFIQNLAQGNIQAFQETLQEYLRTSSSYFDFNVQTPEAVYHAFILGIVVGLRDNYIIQSNRESGYGRCDVALIPKDPSKHKAMILEFKRTDSIADLEKTATLALDQISQHDYAALFAQHPIKTITALGIAFAAKEVHVDVRELTLMK